MKQDVFTFTKDLRDEIISDADKLFVRLSGLDFTDLVDAVNGIRSLLHERSPFKQHPVDFVQWVQGEEVERNDYNPNSIAAPEFKLLELSIEADGFTQPIVSNKEDNTRRVVDGFHRNLVGKESKQVRESVFGYLPIVQIRAAQSDRPDRIAATIRHNRARGKHSVEGMSDIVLELKRRNWSDEKIGKNLGMDPDEILRLSQVGALSDMFVDCEFSEAWEAGAIDENDRLDDAETEEGLSPLLETGRDAHVANGDGRGQT